MLLLERFCAEDLVNFFLLLVDVPPAILFTDVLCET